MRPSGDRQIVESDHAQVLRNPQPALPRRLIEAQRLLVVACEDRGWPAGQVEQIPAAPEAALVLEVTMPHERPVEGDAVPLEGRTVTVDPGPAAQEVFGPGDGRDPPVAEAEQVFGGRQAAGQLVAPTLARSGGGGSTGSTTTSGMPPLRSCSS